MITCASKIGVGSKLLEPSLFINNFLVKSLNKFGIVPSPKEILEMLEDNPHRNISMSHLGTNSPIKNIFSRPILDNTNGLFESVLKRNLEGEDFSATPIATSLFLEWLLKRGEVEEVSFNIEIELDELANAFANAKNREFSPLRLERLLKLFAIFYGKEFQNQIKFLSAIQLNMIDADKGDLTFFDKSNFKDLEKLVKSIKKKYENKFSSNNIFNKILEELKTAQILQREGYIEEIIQGILVLKPQQHSIEKSKNYFLQLIEG